MFLRIGRHCRHGLCLSYLIVRTFVRYVLHDCAYETGKDVLMPAAPSLRTPFLIVNPKAYLGGAETLRLALLTDELAVQFGIDVIFTAQHAYLVEVAKHTTHMLVTAQHMDPITPGRGMGHTLPEALVEAGAGA